MRGSQRNRQTCRTSARKGHNSNRMFLYRSKSQRAYENPGAAWGVKLGSCSSEASENCEGTPNPNVKLNLAGIPTPKRHTHTHAPSLLHRIVPDRVELQPLALTASGDLCSLDSGQGPGCSGMLWRLDIGFRIGPMRARPGILSSQLAADAHGLKLDSRAATKGLSSRRVELPFWISCLGSLGQARCQISKSPSCLSKIY